MPINFLEKSYVKNPADKLKDKLQDKLQDIFKDIY